MAKIGILGGGQLAKMLGDAAHIMGHQVMVLDPSDDACGRFSAKHIIAPYNDKNALKEMTTWADVITYEFENVPSDAIDYLEEIKANIPQGRAPLYISQDRIREKSAVAEYGVKTAPFVALKNQESLIKAVEEIGFPCILKTCSGGYDGKGQWKIVNAEDLKKVLIKEGDYILEKMINFDLEVSCLVVRGINGEVVSCPVGENIHKNGILHLTIVPARIDDFLNRKIQEIAQKIISSLNFVGPLGIEFFVKGDDIYFNEMAPRPHNSAHYTMDACDYSQFDLHIKSILGEEMPTPKLLSPVVMLNILGEDKLKIEKLESKNNQKIHLYGKSEWKEARKMGHINFLGDNINHLIGLAEGVSIL